MAWFDESDDEDSSYRSYSPSPSPRNRTPPPPPRNSPPPPPPPPRDMMYVPPPLPLLPPPLPPLPPPRHRYGLPPPPPLQYYGSPSRRPLKRLKTIGTRVKDKISALPDSILHHILSFRDMTEVIQTSEISKRWRSLWKSVPSLNFRYLPRSSAYNNFPKFVNRIFLLRNEDVNIDKLRLSYRKLSYNDLWNWIKIAETRNLSELYVFVPSNHAPRMMTKFPPCIFTSNKIKVVRLGSNNGGGYLRLPKSMCSAPCLKTLELESIALPKCNSRKEVIIDCPVLEELIMTDCNQRGIRTLRISAPQLKSLVVHNRIDEYFGFCEISIFTPSLVSLLLNGLTYPCYSFGNLGSLVDATFSIHEDSIKPVILHQVLQGLHSVKTLRLGCKSVEVDRNMPDQILKPFSNLRSLQLMGFGDRSDGCLFRNVLAHVPLLEVLKLRTDHLEMDKNWIEFFQCVSWLKSIEIEGVEGNETELKFFEIVLGNSVVLETFIWTVGESFYRKTKKERVLFNMKLQSLPRASPKAQLILDP